MGLTSNGWGKSVCIALLLALAFVAVLPAQTRRTSTDHQGQMGMDAQRRLRKLAPEAASADVVFGYTARSIVEHASRLGADLIVMGSHGRTGIAHVLLGSVAEAIVRTAPCPVLTVRERVNNSQRVTSRAEVEAIRAGE